VDGVPWSPTWEVTILGHTGHRLGRHAPYTPHVSPPAPPIRVVDLDWRSVLVATAAFSGLVAAGALVAQSPRAVTVLVIGTLLALALNPLVSAAQRAFGDRRPPAVAVVLLGVIAVATLGVLLLGPPAIDQARELGSDIERVASQVEDLPVVGDDLERADAAQDIERWVEDLPARLSGDATPLEDVARRAVDGLVAVSFTILVTVTLMLDGPWIVARARRLRPPSRRAQADRIANLAYDVVGRYVAGSVLVAGIAGTFVLAAGLALGIPLTPLLAVWVAIFDLVPQIGGAAGGVPFVLLALTQGAGTAVIAAVLFVLYLQFENHLLSPLVVGKAVRLSPPVTMAAALVGVSAGGVVGALVAVPVVASVKVVYVELRGRRQLAAEAATSVPAAT
jgi:predicted PurR-regulated permease PerM